MTCDNYLDDLKQGMGILKPLAQRVRERLPHPTTVQFEGREFGILPRDTGYVDGQEAIGLFEHGPVMGRELIVRRVGIDASRSYIMTQYSEVTKSPRKTIHVEDGTIDRVFGLSELARHIEQTGDSSEIGILLETNQILELYLGEHE